MKKMLITFMMLLIGSFAFAENIVITSIQPLYSLVSYATKGTSIKVYPAFGSDVSMTISAETIKEKDFDLSIAKKAQAVVDISKIWDEDAIYGKARSYKIDIIPIDASHSYDDQVSPLFFTYYENGMINPFVWTGSKNAVRMINIIARDLEKIYQKEKSKIEQNVIDFTHKLIEEEKKVNNDLVNVKSTEVITLTKNLDYFLNDLNIYSEFIDYSTITANNVANIIKEKGINVIVSDRWLKKNIIKAINEAGGKFVVINTLDIPLDLDGKMDPEAILKVYNENTAELIKALKD